MFLPPASGGAQGPHGKGCTRAAPQKCQNEFVELLTHSLARVWAALSSKSCRHSVHPPALSSRFPPSDTPAPGTPLPGTQHSTAQHARDEHWDGLQPSLAAANPTKHSHTQRAIMTGLGSGLPSALGGDPAPCAALCGHSWPLPLVLGTREGSPALWFHRDLAPSPHISQARGSREHQGYPKAGCAMSPGLLCGA